MTQKSVKIESRSVRRTERTGEALAKLLKPGDTVLLDGNLGVGKTAFVRGLCRGLGIGSGVTSPTFALMNVYGGVFPDGTPCETVHCDAYRLGSREDLYDIGFYDFDENSVRIVEWAGNVFASSGKGPDSIGDAEREKILEESGENCFYVYIKRRDDIAANRREITVMTSGTRGDRLADIIH